MIADVAAADNHRVCIHADIIANSGSPPPVTLSIPYQTSLTDIEVSSAQLHKSVAI